MRRCCPDCGLPLPDREALEARVLRLAKRRAELESELEVVLLGQEEVDLLMQAHDRAEEQEEF